jgi:hypothetical protein
MLAPLVLCSLHAATLVNRWSFDTDLDGTLVNNMTVDSVGGNSGILQNGATVELGQLTLSGLGTGTAANLMAFTNRHRSEFRSCRW